MSILDARPTAISTLPSNTWSIQAETRTKFPYISISVCFGKLMVVTSREDNHFLSILITKQSGDTFIALKCSDEEQIEIAPHFNILFTSFKDEVLLVFMKAKRDNVWRTTIAYIQLHLKGEPSFSMKSTIFLDDICSNTKHKVDYVTSMQMRQNVLLCLSYWHIILFDIDKDIKIKKLICYDQHFSFYEQKGWISSADFDSYGNVALLSTELILMEYNICNDSCITHNMTKSGEKQYRGSAKACLYIRRPYGAIHDYYIIFSPEEGLILWLTKTGNILKICRKLFVFDIVESHRPSYMSIDQAMRCYILLTSCVTEDRKLKSSMFSFSLLHPFRKRFEIILDQFEENEQIMFLHVGNDEVLMIGRFQKLIVGFKLPLENLSLQTLAKKAILDNYKLENVVSLNIPNILKRYLSR